MKATMKGAVLFLALSAIPFAASAQDWRDHGRDRGQQQPANGGNGGQQQRDWRGNHDNNGRGWGDRGNWQRNGNGYAQRPQMPPPQINNYYGRGGYGDRGYDRGRDYRYAPPPRAYYPRDYGRRYYSVGYGYRPEPVWTVGNVYYGDDYAPTYSVDDYGDYGLYAPPRGYGWRRDDFGHFLLVAITSGIIADLLLGH